MMNLLQSSRVLSTHINSTYSRSQGQCCNISSRVQQTVLEIAYGLKGILHSLADYLYRKKFSLLLSLDIVKCFLSIFLIEVKRFFSAIYHMQTNLGTVLWYCCSVTAEYEKNTFQIHTGTESWTLKITQARRDLWKSFGPTPFSQKT